MESKAHCDSVQFSNAPHRSQDKTKTLVVADKHSIYPSYHPELVSCHLLHILQLQTFGLQLLLQLFKYVHFLSTPELLLCSFYREHSPCGFTMFGASYHEGLSSTVSLSEVSLTSDLHWSKLRSTFLLFPGLLKD